jgi:hypothetical protein
MAAQRQQLEQVADLALAVRSAYDRKVAAQAEADAADRELRDQVGALAELAQSVESIADLSGVPLKAVRGARRPVPGRRSSGGEEVGGLADGLLRREAAASVALDRDETQALGPVVPPVRQPDAPAGASQ